MSAFMGGKMKIKGNMGLAQKFGALATAAMKAPAAKKRKGSGGADAPRKPSAGAAGGPAGFGSTAVFERIGANLRAHALSQRSFTVHLDAEDGRMLAQCYACSEPCVCWRVSDICDGLTGMLDAAGLVAMLPLHTLRHRMKIVEGVAPEQASDAQEDKDAAAAEEQFVVHRTYQCAGSAGVCGWVASRSACAATSRKSAL